MIPLSTKSGIWIGAIIDDLRPQLAFLVQLHQIVPAPDHRDRDRERVPHVLPYHLEIERPQRPDRIAGHANVTSHDGHNAILDHESSQGRQLMSELLMLIAFVRIRVSPFVAVLAAEGVELIGDSTDDAFDCFLAFGRGDGDDRDMVFVLHLAVRDRPFVILVDRMEERLLGCCLAEDLVADAGAGQDEVGKGAAGCGDQTLATIQT